MTLEHQLRIVGFAAVMIGAGLVTVHARACASDEVTVVKIPVPVVVMQAPAVAVDAPPAASATPTPPATPDTPASPDPPNPPAPAAIPTATMPCVDSTAELLVDDHLPVLCWGEHCLTYRDDITTTTSLATSTPRPASPPNKSGADDARGRRHGKPTNVVAVDADLSVVFGKLGEITMIAHGRRVATADFFAASYLKPRAVAVHAVALDQETVAARWCVAGMCYLSRISLGGTEPDADRAYIQLSDAMPLPRCSG